MPSPVVFFQIATADPAAARAFYGQLFDWEFSETGNPVTPISINPKGPADFDPNGSFLQLPPGAPPFVGIFVRVDDLGATVAKAEGLGAKVVLPITETAGGTHLAIIRGPEGHSIGIVQA
jgi:predicted enzyme related to lactoylglutathione lyase